MGYHLNYLDAPVFMAVPKPMLTEFGIDYRLESCGDGVGKLKFGEIKYQNKWNFEFFFYQSGNKQAE